MLSVRRSWTCCSRSGSRAFGASSQTPSRDPPVWRATLMWILPNRMDYRYVHIRCFLSMPLFIAHFVCQMFVIANFWCSFIARNCTKTKVKKIAWNSGNIRTVHVSFVCLLSNSLLQYIGNHCTFFSSTFGVFFRSLCHKRQFLRLDSPTPWLPIIRPRLRFRSPPRPTSGLKATNSCVVMYSY